MPRRFARTRSGMLIAAGLAVAAFTMPAHGQSSLAPRNELEHAATPDDRQLVELDAGADLQLHSVQYHTKERTVALASTSSEFISVAVIEGTLTQDHKTARAGEVLVTPIDGGQTRRFVFDAARLTATLAPAMLAKVEGLLGDIARRQERKRFWGLLEPVNLNAAAPVSADLEAVRQTYLGTSTVIDLRSRASGDPVRLAQLTAERFVAAAAQGDARAVADLIDPQPFTATNADPASWQAARLAFAGKVAADPALKTAFANPPVAVPEDQTAFDAGAYRLHLVPRDRAMFVSSVEKVR